MKRNTYRLTTYVWLYPGAVGWHFITIPEDISSDITRQFGDVKRGWGSLPVRVTIGKTTWETSIFPDKKAQGYLLPVKALVRKKEGIRADNKVTLTLEVTA